MKKKRKFVKNRAKNIPKLESVIIDFIKNNKLESVMDFITIKKNWIDLVGDRLHNFCKPSKLENKILYIKTTSSVWRNEVFFLKNDIVKRINYFFAKKIIIKIIII